MNSLVTSPPLLLHPERWGEALTAEELDTVVGGIDFLGIAVLVFSGSVIVGILDRLLFGGCKCR